MTEAQDNPPPDFDAKLALLDGKLEAISNLAQVVTEIVQTYGKAARQMTESSDVVRERLLPLVQRISPEKNRKPARHHGFG